MTVCDDRTRIRDINQLKLPQRQIASAIGHWRRRLKLVTNKNGGHIEPYL
jgi:hypothetical protein